MAEVSHVIPIVTRKCQSQSLDLEILGIKVIHDSDRNGLNKATVPIPLYDWMPFGAACTRKNKRLEKVKQKVIESVKSSNFVHKGEKEKKVDEKRTRGTFGSAVMAELNNDAVKLNGSGDSVLDDLSCLVPKLLQKFMFVPIRQFVGPSVMLLINWQSCGL